MTIPSRNSQKRPDNETKKVLHSVVFFHETLVHIYEKKSPAIRIVENARLNKATHEHTLYGFHLFVCLFFLNSGLIC